MELLTISPNVNTYSIINHHRSCYISIAMLHANNNLKIYYCSASKNKEIFLTTYLNVKQLAQLDLIENILNSEMLCEMHILYTKSFEPVLQQY